MKYLIATVAFVGLLAPSAAFALCNGVGNACSGTYGITAQYAPETSRQYIPSQYQQYGYQPSGYSAPMYFPVYNTYFPTSQGYSYGGQGYYPYQYGYGTQYGYSYPTYQEDYYGTYGGQYYPYSGYDTYDYYDYSPTYYPYNGYDYIDARPSPGYCNAYLCTN